MNEKLRCRAARAGSVPSTRAFYTPRTLRPVSRLVYRHVLNMGKLLRGIEILSSKLFNRKFRLELFDTAAGG